LAKSEQRIEQLPAYGSIQKTEHPATRQTAINGVLMRTEHQTEQQSRMIGGHD